MNNLTMKIFCQTERNDIPLDQEFWVYETNEEGKEVPKSTVCRGLVFQYSDLFKEFIDDNLAYKSMRYVMSPEGMMGLANLFYTIDYIASRIDKRTINVDGETISIKDYAFTKNINTLISAGVVYTTDSAKLREKKAYDKLVPEVNNGMYLINGKSGKDVFDYEPKLLTPNQVNHVFKSFSKDTDLMQTLENVVPGACTTFDFSVLMADDGEHLYEYVTGAKFTEQVVSLLAIKGPFTDEYDNVRDKSCDKECLRWVLQ